MKKIISIILTIVFICTSSIIVFAEQDSVPGGSAPRLVDEADVLNDSEEKKLLKKLDEITERQQFDVVIVTVNSLDGKNPQDYADDFYDDGGYGIGTNHDGVLLLVSMEYRDWHITTTGFGISAITDAGIDYISNEFLPCLSDGNYKKAFETYASLCDDFVTQAKKGEPYDVGHMPRGSFHFFNKLLISLGVGTVLALIVVLIMRSKMKTVRRQAAASDYVKKGSMVINESKDLFLYTHVDREEISTEDDSGVNSGGSSTHTSSSGTTHGGGGGKF